MITFVALLMFLQLGVGWEQSTLLCGLLTLPWVLKSFVRAKLRQMGHYARQLNVLELGMCATMGIQAFCFTERLNSQWTIFAALFVLCLLCAAHELVARMYYEHMLRPSRQQYFNSLKMFISQSTVVLTYGVMSRGRTPGGLLLHAAQRRGTLVEHGRLYAGRSLSGAGGV